jgi:antibiotic biosynthesis monooxygenase (ABM) superfamily enzyme
VTRSVDPARLEEANRWAQTGMDLAHDFPGFLGSGWIRAAVDSTEWRMLYRFSTRALLEEWETSAARTAWLESGEGFILTAQAVKRTGIEGWFDDTAAELTTETAAIRALARSAPPRWKQAVSIGLGFFPLNVAFTLLATWLVTGWRDYPLVPKVLATTLVMAPTMTFLVMPWITRMLRPWLHKARR